MPPEQAAGRHGDIGPASDVYSLGAILYELLTARPPFGGATALATLHEVMESDPASLRRLKADIPPDLETICLKCLEKSPSARYPSARAFAEELDRFLKGEPIQARPASPIRKAVSWTRRHPGTLSALAALVIVTLAFGVFYLFEENAFLRAQQANPSLARVRGPRHETLDTWNTIACIAVAIGVFSLIAIRGWARGLRFKQSLIPGWYHHPLQPLGKPALIFATTVGLIMVGCGLVLLVETIQAKVWEGEAIAHSICMIYLSIYWGLLILGIVVRDYRLVHYGMSGKSFPKLTAEQLEPIRRALEEDYDIPGAIRLYREAVPEAGLADVKRYVTRLYFTLRAEHREKFVLPPLSLATLNWKVMLRMAMIEAAILGMVCYDIPPSDPASAVWQFGLSFLLGMGLMLGLRVSASWKTLWRRLLLFPALVLMFAGWVFTTGLAQSAWPYLCGLICGVILMLSGFRSLRSIRKRV